MDIAELTKRLCTPPVLLEKDDYLIKFAMTEEEVNAALRLRYHIFKLEQKRGITETEDEIDRDQYDDECLHLLVEKKSENKIVGTYRVHLGPVALQSHHGFYSEQEFHMKGLDEIAPEVIEVGRACVASEHRNGTVVALLWGGISMIMGRSQLRYLMGCASLEDSRPEAPWALYDYFCENGKCSDQIHATPTDAYKMERPSKEAMDAFLAQEHSIRSLLPPLFKGYLHMGIKICGEPVFDRDFGVYDFFVLLDVAKLPERYNKHFNVNIPHVPPEGA